MTGRYPAARNRYIFNDEFDSSLLLPHARSASVGHQSYSTPIRFTNTTSQPASRSIIYRAPTIRDPNSSNYPPQGPNMLFQLSVTIQRRITDAIDAAGVPRPRRAPLSDTMPSLTSGPDIDRLYNPISSRDSTLRGTMGSLRSTQYHNALLTHHLNPVLNPTAAPFTPQFSPPISHSHPARPPPRIPTRPTQLQPTPAASPRSMERMGLSNFLRQLDTMFSNEGLEGEKGEGECPVCLEGYTMKIAVRPCGHGICGECFTVWQEHRLGLGMNACCPVCSGVAEGIGSAS